MNKRHSSANRGCGSGNIMGHPMTREPIKFEIFSDYV